ncbi:MAG: S8 family serine peptidase, partial [Phycisphaerales bacterium]|nr:S8 family serine peptidase [Phycisphaerales bacterium]
MLIAAFVGITTVGGRAADSYVPGEVLIAPRTGQADAVADMLSRHRRPIAKRSRFSDIVAVSVPVGTEQAWIDIFHADPAIAYAELNGIGEGGVVPNDTHFGSQYHHRNTGQSGGTVDADIDSDLAWDITTGSSDIVIAVLDTGIDSDHPDFSGRIDPDGFDFVNGDSNPEADHPHGTWTSGCIGANANDGFGVAGVDWNCKILPIKVLNSANLGTVQDLADGLNYVATQTDVSIVNMSLINYPSSPSITNAITNCRNNGKILFACAGNSGVGTANGSWPGASPDTITIGATDRFDQRASFSSTGSAVDFVAPGHSIATV